MHVLTLTAPLDTGSAFGVLEPGNWLLQDQNAFECALMAERGTARLEKRNASRKRHIYDDVNGTLVLPSESVLFIRSGAIGDLLLMSPAICAFKKANPDATIHLSCREQHHAIFGNTGFSPNLIGYPIKAELADIFDRVISLEDVMELSDIHATDTFAAALGVTVEDYRPVFQLTEEERESAGVMMSGKRPKIGVQLKASTHNRNYPMDQWAKVIIGLEDRGWEVFLFGTPGQVPPLPPALRRTFIHDMSQSGMSFRETASILSHCNAFVGVDSALIHLCHALDVPAVGLYGAFSWQTRTAKAPLTHALMGTGECANCRWHAKLGQHFPDMPCRRTKKCSVLASIAPEIIITKVDGLKP